MESPKGIEVDLLCFGIIFTNIVELFCTFVIRSYHQNKPPGLQSLLSKVIVLFTWSFDLTTCAATVVVIYREIFGDFSHFMSVVLTLFGYLVSTTLYTNVLYMIATKYTLIYHR